MLKLFAILVLVGVMFVGAPFVFLRADNHPLIPGVLIIMLVAIIAIFFPSGSNSKPKDPAS